MEKVSTPLPGPRPAGREGIAAAQALRLRLRAAVAAGASAAPGPWSERERQALDGLRAVAAFLHHHGNTDVAQAITRELRAGTPA